MGQGFMTEIAIVSPGAMGSAMGAILASKGARVTTSLTGRSAASTERARSAGFTVLGGDDEMVAGADFILAILPPSQAEALAQRLKAPISRSAKKPIYIDCNAISPETAKRIGAALEGSGCKYVDGGIIGLPPKGPGAITRIYVAGEAAKQAMKLNDLGLNVRLIDGPIGAASALKMAYAGVTKGLTALASVMALAATRAGSAEAFRQELSETQPQLLAWCERQVPNMFSKAYRFVGEMEEISDFLGEDAAGADMFDAIAKRYQQLADDNAAKTPGGDIAQLAEFFAKSEEPARKRA
jgi:3-hydroxyisobutyrate dehydrogenase-like beta-hydroxyacid dehydrogenase